MMNLCEDPNGREWNTILESTSMSTFDLMGICDPENGGFVYLYALFTQYRVYNSSYLIENLSNSTTVVHRLGSAVGRR
jgi:hypothetical protein